jgi:hypothetical protein
MRCKIQVIVNKQVIRALIGWHGERKKDGRMKVYPENELKANEIINRLGSNSLQS